MAQLDIIRYTPDMKKEWDEFIDRSKNGTFILRRDYMDYHSDRFQDHSLLFTKGGTINAVLPACSVNNTLVAHAGLTYGGFIMSLKTSAELTLHFFDMLFTQLHKDGYKELLVKPVPHIYHKIPAEEDLYALFRHNGRLAARNISVAIYMANQQPFSQLRKRGVKRALNDGIHVCESNDYAVFWKILEDNLSSKYNAKPVHSLEEILQLSRAFPDNIKLYLAISSAGEPLGGTVLFITSTVVHTQYISATPEGKQRGAIDILFEQLIKNIYPECHYFDFGTSNEEGGRVLNESLIHQKEGFGARAICYDTYSIKL